MKVKDLKLRYLKKLYGQIIFVFKDHKEILKTNEYKMYLKWYKDLEISKLEPMEKDIANYTISYLIITIKE